MYQLCKAIFQISKNIISALNISKIDGMLFGFGRKFLSA